MRTILLCLLITLSASAADFKFKLSEYQKLEGTFSGELDRKESVHFVIAKNKSTKKFDVLTFFTDASGNVKQLETIYLKKAPSIISYHKSGNILTVLNYDDELLRVIDYNTETLKAAIKETEDFVEPKNIFRLKDKTIIVQHKGTKGGLKINEIRSCKDIKTKEADIPEAQSKEYKQFFKVMPEAVNSNEFVKNGSISETKSYIINDNLVITADDKKEGITKTMTINATTGKADFKTFTNKTYKQRDITSYIYGNNLFSIGLNKEDLKLKSFDLSSGAEKTSYSLNGELAEASKNKDAKTNFLKEASRGSMAPTVTVNRAGNNYAVRMDAVHRDTYNYNYNWYHMHWMMQQQWMMHQQMMQNNMRVMQMSGPAPAFYDHFITPYIEKKDIAFTILLDDNLKLVNNSEINTDMKDIDKDKYLNDFKDNKEITQFTAAFLDGEMRYIYQDKKSKEIFISHKSL